MTTLVSSEGTFKIHAHSKSAIHIHFFNFLKIFIFVDGFCQYVSALCVPSAFGGLKVPNPLKLQLLFVSFYLGAGN